MICFHTLHVPNPCGFESLSLKTPQTKTVTQTPGTALQNKIESKLEKSLGQHINIQLQQQMECFQSSMLEAMKSLRDEMQAMKKASEVEVDETFASVPKTGPAKCLILSHIRTLGYHPITWMLNPWGGGAPPLQQVFRSLIPGSRYLLTSPGCYGKVFSPSLMYLTV